ncbi:MAG: DNA-processing protein DprA [Candidatus Thiodiazotropha sp.]
MALPRDELEPWFLIALTPGIGSRYFLRLLSHFRTPEGILSASRGALRDLGIPQSAVDHLLNPDRNRLQSLWSWYDQPDHGVLTLADPDYPSVLLEIEDPPPLIYWVGQPATLQQPQMAIVGSRNPTPNGLANAREFARFLASAGWCICSGLAQGIDGAAHIGALQSGTTLAVMGTGPDRIYPASHRALAHQIAAAGLLVTEFPPGTPPKADHFPRRNRLISGLSRGVLVVEATTQSGSLITARLAGEQGREVFSIPGSIHNPQARGCHALIRQGAKLVESAEDILEEIGALTETPPRTATSAPADTPVNRSTDPDYERLREALGYDPVSVDELIARTGLTAEAVSSMLLLLELEGHVSSAPGGFYSRTESFPSRTCGKEST